MGSIASALAASSAPSHCDRRAHLQWSVLGFVLAVVHGALPAPERVGMIEQSECYGRAYRYKEPW